MKGVYRILFELLEIGTGVREAAGALVQLGLAVGAIAHFWLRVLCHRGDASDRRGLDLLVACGVTAAGVLMLGLELAGSPLAPDGGGILADLVDVLEARGLLGALRPRASRWLERLAELSEGVSHA